MASNSMIINIGIKGAKGAVRGIGKVSGALASAGKMAGLSALKFAKFGAVAGVAFGGAALRESSRFADNLREIGTLGSAVSEDMARLSKELRLTAGEFGQPIGAVAKAQYDIISAGFNEVAVSSEILRASSQLAVAGVTDVGTTADVITSSMNAYALSTEDVGMVSANLFQTVKSGKTTMTELGASLGQVIPFSASAVSADPVITWLVMFYAATMIIFTMYGGGFATIPAYLADIFGTLHVGGIHGRLLTAWSTAGVLGPFAITYLRNNSLESAIKDLAAKVDPNIFFEKFGTGIENLDQLISAKTVTISKLMEVVPDGTIDPTPSLYNSTMYAMAGLLVIAFFSNLFMKPVDKKHHVENTHPEFKS